MNERLFLRAFAWTQFATRSILTACAVGTLTGISLAEPIAIANHNFETNAPADGAINSAAPPSWTSNNTGDGYFNPNGTQLQYNNPLLADTSATGGVIGTMDGPTFGFIFSTGNSGTFSQTLGATLTADTIYTLTTAFGRRDTAFGQDSSTATINLLAGGDLIATATGDPDDFGASSSFTDLIASAQIGPTHPQLGQPLVIQLVKGAAGNYLDIDNVRLSAVAVPEPSTLFIWIVLGVFGIFIASRRRVKATAC